MFPSLDATESEVGIVRGVFTVRTAAASTLSQLKEFSAHTPLSRERVELRAGN
ncbi:MAG: hypothetical protein QXQ91_03215 [Nanopusillaceae archaeon]